MNGAETENNTRKIKFSLRLFGIFFGALLLMSGIHMGFLVLMEEYTFPVLLEILVPVAYWALVAFGLVRYTGRQVKRSYEIPLRELAKAANQVAHGDFSVYVRPTGSPEHRDYFDNMIMDFNKMVEELGSIETLKTDFFTNVSHEIKAPLSVIQVNAELLQKKNLSEEERREYTGTILFAVRRLSDLITNMLKLNKLEKQAIKPMPETYDLCAQLCDCALQFENVWEKKEIEFEADLEDRILVTADQELLNLAWTNLLSNAMKFTPPGGTVALRQTRDGTDAVVSVTDTGCGMSEETVAHIFDKFYQGDTSHSTEGNGLGLALVKRVLELSDGTIFVESEEGRGSTFTVRLPLAEVQAP